MVVDIAKVDPVRGLDRLVGVSCQAIEHLALGVEDLLQADGRTLQAEDRLEGLGARVRDHLVLDRVHPVVAPGCQFIILARKDEPTSRQEARERRIAEA